MFGLASSAGRRRGFSAGGRSVGLPAPSASATSAEPRRFSPPSSWNRTELSGLAFYTPGDWVNGFPDQSAIDTSKYLCLLPPGVTPEGLSTCRSAALTFSLSPDNLATEADWRREIGSGIVHAAYVGDDKAFYRQFTMTDSDGTQARLRTSWLPVIKGSIPLSTLDTTRSLTTCWRPSTSPDTTLNNAPASDA